VTHPDLHATFTRALDALTADIREDRSILAAILCGSLSHDAVWKHSDIDLVLVTIDDKKIEQTMVSLNADGLNVHASLVPRAEFRKLAEGSVRNSFMHSLLAKGRLLYSHDASIEQMCAGLHDIGERDSAQQVFRAATAVLPSLYKAHKFFETRNDAYYTAIWILYTATPLAQVEVMGARLIADREVIPQATKLNPGLFQSIYTGLLDGRPTRETVAAALDVIDTYMARRAPELFAPLLAYLRETGEARSVTELDAHFARHFGVQHASMACEYLADRGLIAKVSITRQLTRRSNVSVQELAFVHLGDRPHD
jgi:uncharacterized protein